jgi:hypothetical protein
MIIDNLDYLENKKLMESLDFNRHEIIPVVLDALTYSLHKLDDNIFNALQEEIDDMLKTNFNNEFAYNERLAGSIRHEYKLKSHELINSYLDEVMPKFWMANRFPEDSDVYNSYWRLQKNKDEYDVWVNFQKKHEYNPLHAHSGDLSFVIWMKMPYDRQAEMNYENIKLKRESDVFAASSFTFRWNSLRGGIKRHTIPLDKSYEGIMAIFPSNLMHEVYPFYTSDDYRISISGNIVAYPKDTIESRKYFLGK